MTETSSRTRTAAIAILAGAPIASLAINVLSWLHYGIDLPFYDDMRAYVTRHAGSLDLKVLFTPSNDTLYPVGMALDAVAQRGLNGNAVAYQFISMVCLLGGLLWLQWRLLAAALGDRLQTAAAFSLTLLMLWPGSYWGQQSLTYHHGLPMLFLLGALALIVTARWRAWWSLPPVFLLGLLAGLSYISGAFAVLAAALALIGLSFFAPARFQALRKGGAALLAAGVVTAGAQVAVIVFSQHGRIHQSAYDPAAPWAWPTEAPFWMFILGKIGRALALPFDQPLFSFFVVLGLLAFVMMLMSRLLQRLARERAGASEDVARTATVFLSLTAAVGAYLMLLAAGRAYMGGPDRTFMGMFIHGFPQHYHPFWITLLMPWIAAAVLVTWRGAVRSVTTPRHAAAAAVAAGALVLVAAQAGAFAHGGFYRRIAAERMRTDVACVRTLLQTGVRECPSFYGPELVDGLTYARQIGASFTRYFPLSAIPLGTEDPSPLFRLSRDGEKVKFVNLSPPAPTADGFAFDAGEDAILEVTLPPGSLAACWEMEVSMSIKSGRDDFAELFALKPTQAAFAAPAESSAPTRSDMFTSVVLRAYSLQGFKDELRIDPVAGAQAITVKELEVRCRRNVPAPSD